MTQETHPTPPRAVAPSIVADSGRFRVAIYAPRGPRTYLGPRVLLWSGKSEWSCETSPWSAWEFASAEDATSAASEVLSTFDWNTPSARPRIVEVIDAAGVVVSKVGIGANGIGALRLM